MHIEWKIGVETKFDINFSVDLETLLFTEDSKTLMVFDGL